MTKFSSLPFLSGLDTIFQTGGAPLPFLPFLIMLEFFVLICPTPERVEFVHPRPLRGRGWLFPLAPFIGWQEKHYYWNKRLFSHIRSMREYAFLLLCFCWKTHIDTEKYPELLKMAKWGTRSPLVWKSASMPPKTEKCAMCDQLGEL